MRWITSPWTTRKSPVISLWLIIKTSWTTDRFLSPTEQKHGGFNEVVSPSPLHIHTYDKNNISKFTEMQRNLDMTSHTPRTPKNISGIFNDIIYVILTGSVGGSDLVNQILFIEEHKSELVLANNRLRSLDNNPT